jgi:hypothetical protein
MKMRCTAAAAATWPLSRVQLSAPGCAQRRLYFWHTRREGDDGDVNFISRGIKHDVINRNYQNIFFHKAQTREASWRPVLLVPGTSRDMTRCDWYGCRSLLNIPHSISLLVIADSDEQRP